jgi:hypothetical protein
MGLICAAINILRLNLRGKIPGETNTNIEIRERFRYKVTLVRINLYM